MRSYVDDARRSVVHLRTGTLHVPTVEATLRNRWRRFLFGFTLPFVLANRCLHHAELGPRAQRVLLAQVVIAAVLGIAWYVLVDFEDIKIGENGHISMTDGATGIAAFIGALAITEWLVIALSRELHDQIGADVARLVGVEPDEDVVDPRVRVNLRWIATKMRRRLQGVLVMGVTLIPFIVVVGSVLVVAVPFFGDAINVGINAAAALVIYYWVAVIALGKTSWAWRQAPDRDPLPLHVLTTLGARSRVLFPFRMWAWSLRKSMAMLVRPARLLESCGAEGAGLALARVMMGLPLVYVVARPFFPVASTVLLQARAPQLFIAAPPETTTDPTTTDPTTTTTTEPVTTTE